MRESKRKKPSIVAIANVRQWKVFYTTILFIGTILNVLEIEIYRSTVINIFIPIAILLVVGIIGYCFNRKHYNRIYNLGGFFIPLVQNLFSYGSIACYTFMAINYYFPGQEAKTHRFPISEKSSMPGGKGSREKRQPLVRIDYFGVEKELVFRYSSTSKVEKADSVEVTFRRGKLGFDVLDHYDVF